MTNRVVEYVFRGNFTGLSAGLTTAGKNVTGLGAKMTALDKNGRNLRAGLTQVGKAAGVMGLAAGAGLGIMIKSAADFDESMSAINAATHETSSNMELFRRAALKAGADTKYSATEAAGGIEALAKAGVSTRDILKGGLDGALALAAAGNQSVADSAETAASAMTQFHLSGKDIPHIADLLAAGAGKAQGEVSDLAQALGQAGLVAHQTGLSVEDTTATLSAFASAGLMGSDAGTSLKQMLLALTPQSDKAAKTMAKMGISAYDAQGNFVGITQYAGVLHDKLKDLSAEQRNATLKIIFGSDAIRAASILYDQGSKGIDKWRTAVNQQGYAADTAARKMDNLKGDLEQLRGSLETAFIGSGEGSQGALRPLVEDLTKVVNVYNKLPDAAQSAGARVLAFTTVAGGSVWALSKLVNFAGQARETLKKLGLQSEVTGNQVSGMRGKLGKAAGLAAGFTALGTAIGILGDNIGRINADDIDRNLTSLARGGSSPDMDRAVDNLSYLSKWYNSGGFDVGKGLSQLSSIVSLGIVSIPSTTDRMKDNLQQIDQALAGMVEEGHVKKAGEAFAQISQQAQAAGVSTDELKSRFEAYETALSNVETASGVVGHATVANTEHIHGATKATHSLTGAVKAGAQASVHSAEAHGKNAKATEHAAEKAKQATEDHKKLAAQLKAERKSATETANQFITLGNDLDNTKVSLDNWIKQLAKQADALRNFRLNAIRAAHEGLDQGLIKSLEAAGPAGALRMKQLADGTKEQIARANAAWERGRAEMQRYKDFVVPPKKITVDDSASLAEIRRVKEALRELQDKTIRITTVHVTGGHSVAGQADGGTVGGPRYPYGDKVLTMLAPGEEVISNRHGQADRFRADRAAGRIPGYAEGGTVVGMLRMGSPTAGDAGIPSTIAGVKSALRDLEHELHASEKAISDERSARDALRQRAQSLSAGIRDSFRSDLWADASSTSPWAPGATGTGFTGGQAALKADIAHARAFRAALKRLRAKGVTGAAFAAIAASGNLAEAEAYASESRGDLRTYSHLYGERQRITASVGQYAADVRYGHQLEQSNAHLAALVKSDHHQEQRLKALEKKLEQLRKEARANADHTGNVVAHGVNHGARSGLKKAKRW